MLIIHRAKAKSFPRLRRNSISKNSAILIPSESLEFDAGTSKQKKERKTQSIADCLSTRSKLSCRDYSQTSASRHSTTLCPEKKKKKKYPGHTAVSIVNSRVPIDRGGENRSANCESPLLLVHSAAAIDDFQCCERNINPLSDNYICIEPRHACFTRMSLFTNPNGASAFLSLFSFFFLIIEAR